jgi:chromosome segregation ATPase
MGDYLAKKPVLKKSLHSLFEKGKDLNKTMFERQQSLAEVEEFHKDCTVMIEEVEAQIAQLKIAALDRQRSELKRKRSMDDDMISKSHLKLNYCLCLTHFK